MKNQEIRHDGKIIQIDPDFTIVEIVSSSACSECHAKSLCSVSEDEKKEICVPTSPYSSLKIGDSVYVCLKKSLGMKAVWLSFVVPVLILMLSIMLLSGVFEKELLTGACAIAAVAFYYLVLYLLRDRIAKDYVFYLKEK